MGKTTLQPWYCPITELIEAEIQSWNNDVIQVRNPLMKARKILSLILSAINDSNYTEELTVKSVQDND